MLAQNLQDRSVIDAVSRTFDGEHPCALCKGIAEGKKSEKKSDALDLKVKKVEFASAVPEFVFAAPTAFRLLPVFRSQGNSLPQSPPVPPPRCCAA